MCDFVVRNIYGTVDAILDLFLVDKELVYSNDRPVLCFC
jgi:hypothetical protein